MEEQMTKTEIAAAQSTANTLRVSRRSILFFVRTILLILIVVLVCLVAFLAASRISNSYILINEGMALRASSILHHLDDPDLAVYFTEDCLEQDASLRTQSTLRFSDYTVNSYDYDLTVDRFHVMPWQPNIYVDVVENVSSIKASASIESSGSGVPEWTPIRYRLYLKNIDSRWYIDSIELLELNPELPAANTPDPNRSPIPMATPTPEPTAIVFEVP